MTSITFISDLHGYQPDLEGGDLLVIAGDLTAKDTHGEYLKFYSWLHKQKYKHYIFIGGNHDNLLEKDEVLLTGLADTTYLCDTGTEFEGIKIWGAPWTLRFDNQNPACMAFSLKTEKQLKSHWDLIPEDTDILITHMPPKGILDHCNNGRVGSSSLVGIVENIRPAIHIFGHIHEMGGEIFKSNILGTTFINASYVDSFYRPIHKPITIEL